MKNTPYWNIFSDVYGLMKDNYPVKDWDCLFDQANELGQKYENTEVYNFARSLIVNVLEELERVRQ